MTTDSREAAAMTNLVGSKLGNFRLERLLGRGRMGVVYLARDEALLRATAVKILSWRLADHAGQDPETWFLTEARNVARINHPHVVQIYGVAKHGPYCYIAMEYVDGAPADRWLARHGPFSPERATEILLHTANALQAAHDANVVHRDIKPENLLIGANGAAKLGDFGMALNIEKGPPSAGMRAGTPFYTAPEIWRGQGASPASDVYALGATYFYLLTRHPAFEAADLQELIAAHLGAKVPDPQIWVPELPSGCAEIVQRCMAKDPSERYASARRLAWDARGLLRSLASRGSKERIRSTAPPERASSLPARPMREEWLEFFGFLETPFGAVDANEAPVGGAPFSQTRKRLTQLLDEAASLIVLTGERGSGRSTVANQLLAELAGTRLVARVSGENSTPKVSLPQQVLRAFGAVGATPLTGANDIDRLLEQLATPDSPLKQPALLVLDDYDPAQDPKRELAELAHAAAATGLLKMIVVGAPGLPALFPSVGLPEAATAPEVQLPALSLEQTLAYVADWLRATHPRNKSGVMLTPDAALLLASRSAGNLESINRMMLSMLRRAGSERRRVLSSWDAWAASHEERGGAAQPSVQPLPWPTSEVFALLNELRRSAGIAPRSRGKLRANSSGP